MRASERVLESCFIPSPVFQKEKEIDVLPKNAVKDVHDVIRVFNHEACFARDNCFINPTPLFARTPERKSHPGP